VEFPLYLGKLGKNSIMIDLIHIGDYKTGTSWFQKQVFPVHPELYYLDSGIHPEVVHLMHQLIDIRDLDFNPEVLRGRFADVLNDIDSQNRKIVISREALSGSYPAGDHAKRIAERLYAVFGKTKVLIVIREQFSMLKSIYSQYVKIGGTLSFEEFVYDPIVSPGVVEKLKYHKIIDAYVNIFGKENVFVGLFEEFKSDNELFVKRVLEFSGCSDAWQLRSKDVLVNPSLRKAGLEIQRFINHFLRNDFNPCKPIIPLDKVVALFLSSEKKKKLLTGTRNRLIYSMPGCDDAFVLRYAINFALTLQVSKLCERIQLGSKLTIPNSIVESLRDEFVESNKLLHDKYNLHVDKYGWSL
jgi:hypothetical protein